MSTAKANPVVAVQALTKTFKDFWLRTRAKAVDNVTFQIDPGLPVRFPGGLLRAGTESQGFGNVGDPLVLLIGPDRPVRGLDVHVH